MQFAGMNYLAILAAAVAAWIFGAVYYGTVANAWVAALGRTMEDFKAEQAAKTGRFSAQIPFILSFFAELLMAWVLAGVIGASRRGDSQERRRLGALHLGRFRAHHDGDQQRLHRA